MARNRKDVPAGESPGSPRIERLKIADLIPDAANVRKHTDRNRDAVTRSLRRFGPGRSVVLDGANVVVAGNQTVASAAEAGIDEVLVVDALPGQLVAVRRPDWSPSEAAAYGIADNRSAEHAEWDFESLGKQARALIAEGFDLADTGWEPHEVEPILAADWRPPAPGAMPSGDEGGDDGPKGGKDHPYTVVFAPDKFEVIELACNHVRAIEDDEDMATARCIELICADWLNDPNWHGEAAK